MAIENNVQERENNVQEEEVKSRDEQVEELMENSPSITKYFKDHQDMFIRTTKNTNAELKRPIYSNARGINVTFKCLACNIKSNRKTDSKLIFYCKTRGCINSTKPAARLIPDTTPFLTPDLIKKAVEDVGGEFQELENSYHEFGDENIDEMEDEDEDEDDDEVLQDDSIQKTIEALITRINALEELTKKQQEEIEKLKGTKKIPRKVAKPDDDDKVDSDSNDDDDEHDSGDEIQNGLYDGLKLPELKKLVQERFGEDIVLFRISSIISKSSINTLTNLLKQKDKNPDFTLEEFAKNAKRK